MDVSWLFWTLEFSRLFFFYQSKPIPTSCLWCSDWIIVLFLCCMNTADSWILRNGTVYLIWLTNIKQMYTEELHMHSIAFNTELCFIRWDSIIYYLNLKYYQFWAGYYINGKLLWWLLSYYTKMSLHIEWRQQTECRIVILI